MSMNHDLTTWLARDHQRQMLAEARHEPRCPAPQTPRTVTRIIRGLASRLPGQQPTRLSDNGAVALAISTAPDWRGSPDLHVPGTTGWAVTEAGRP